MAKFRTSFYQLLVYTSYGYFILLGLVWFLVTFMSAGRFNYTAFFIIAVFGAQAYYRHRLTNLILGILSLFFSIFMLLDVINSFDLMAKNATYEMSAKVLLTLSCFSIVMAVILIFSYVKLGFLKE